MTERTRPRQVMQEFLALCMRLGVLVCLIAAMIGGCRRQSPSTPPPPTSSAPAELRIVALSPALAIILRDLGYGDQIVGRHAYDLALDPAIPTCGEQGTIDYETLVKVRPTHVFLQWGAQPLPPRLLELAATRHWVVKNLNPLSLREIEDSAREMDQTIFDYATESPSTPVPPPDGSVTPEHVKPAMPFEDDLRRAWTNRGVEMKNAGRILLVSGTKPIGALGPGSFHAQLLEQLGATPALTTGGPWVTLDIEDLNKLAPDGIILFSPRPPRTPEPSTKPSAPELMALFGRAAELDIPAFRNRHVAVIDDPLCLTPSTAMIGIADQMAQILKKWAESSRESTGSGF